MVKYKPDGTKQYYYYQKTLNPRKRGPKPKSESDIGQTYAFYYKYTKKYETKYEFLEKDSARYEYCNNMGWIDKLYPMGCRYNKTRCYELCRGYRNSEDLKQRNIILYDYVVLRNWMSKMFTIYQESHKYSDCYEEAIKYQTYKEFKEKNSAMYNYCLHNNLLKDYTWLVDDRVFVYKDKIDAVYVYKFEELKSVYVGRALIRRLHDRDLEHLHSNDTVSIFSKNNDVPVPEMEVIESGLTIEEGLEKERFYIDYYKNLGYHIINKKKTGIGSGSIGRICSGKWNKKSCYNEALNYNRRGDFEHGTPGAYNVARKNGWLNDYTWFKEKPKHNYWTFDRCKKIASKCNSRGEFSKTNSGAYGASLKNNWLDIFFKKGLKYMKSKKFYKIDPETMEIAGEYNKVSEITSDNHIYRVLNGEKYLYSDGYIYRKSMDVEVNGNKVVDKLYVKDKRDKMEDKYSKVIELLKSGNLSISEVCKLASMYGCKISEPTCRKLKREFC